VKVALRSSAILLLSFLEPASATACPSLPAVKLAECDPTLSRNDACNVGLLRFPAAISKYLIDKGISKTDSPDLQRVPLSNAEVTSTTAVANFMIGRSGEGKYVEKAIWIAVPNAPKPLISGSPFEVGDLGPWQQGATIRNDCGSFSIASLTTPKDRSEHYAFIVFKCKVNGEDRQLPTGVALRNNVPVRIYSNPMVGVCISEAPKVGSERGL